MRELGTRTGRHSVPRHGDGVKIEEKKVEDEKKEACFEKEFGKKKEINPGY